jgi:hypothetical protein
VRRTPAARALISVAIVLACVGTVAVIEQATTPAPSDRHIHLEAFRYGLSPSVLRANRGDRLRLTFSSRDTAHSFMLQDYRVDVKIMPEGGDSIEIFDPLRSTEPPVTAHELELEAGRPGWLGRLITVSRHRCHVYCGPMHGFEQGDLIVRPNWVFVLGLGGLLALPLVGLYRARCGAPAPVAPRPPVDLLRRFPILDRLLKWRALQFYLTLPVLAMLLLAILAGLFGTKVGGRNLAVMATWVIWMTVMAVGLVLVNSRTWCAVCPLPVLGEYLQRLSITNVRPRKEGSAGNRFFTLGRRWPPRLQGDLVRQLSFLTIGTFAASFAGMPRWTAAVLLLFVVGSAVLSIVFEKRAFCRFLCPVTSFLNVYSSVGKVGVRVRDRARCAQCPDKPCYHGNADGWACPFGVYVGGLTENAPCGVCTECFKSCPYDNVTLVYRQGPSPEGPRTRWQAWQVLTMLTLAMAYSLVILSPWPALRDVVNVVDRWSGPAFLGYVAVLWATTLVVVPGLYAWANRAGLAWSGSDLPRKTAYRRFAAAFIPLGLGLWVAFFVTMFMANYTFVLMTLSDPFGWGWDLLGTAGKPWVLLWPGAVPWMQVALVLSGLAFGYRRGYALWREQTGTVATAVRGFLPAAALMFLFAGGMIVYFTLF